MLYCMRIPMSLKLFINMNNTLQFLRFTYSLPYSGLWRLFHSFPFPSSPLIILGHFTIPAGDHPAPRPRDDVNFSCLVTFTITFLQPPTLWAFSTTSVVAPLTHVNSIMLLLDHNLLYFQFSYLITSLIFPDPWFLLFTYLSPPVFPFLPIQFKS